MEQNNNKNNDNIEDMELIGGPLCGGLIKTANKDEIKLSYYGGYVIYKYQENGKAFWVNPHKKI